jgi:hypothetical protein
MIRIAVTLLALQAAVLPGYWKLVIDGAVSIDTFCPS